MAQPLSAERRAHLIREMARDLNWTRRSNASSGPGSSSASDSSTANSRFEATQTSEEHAHQLQRPSQRAHVQRMPQESGLSPSASRPRSLPAELQINTSTLRDAFPEFSDEDIPRAATESPSIEMARGGRFGRDDSALEFSLPIGDSMDYSPALLHRFLPRSSPPKPSAPKSKKSTLAKSHLVGSRNIPQIRKEGARDGPLSKESRLAQNSSDSNAAANAVPQNLPKSFSSFKDFMRKASETGDGNRPGRVSTQQVTASSTNPDTVTSFKMPDLPNLSELVSGIFEDVAPAASSRQRPLRVGRPSNRSIRKSRLAHSQLVSISVPEEEQRIYASLKLLQEKVTALEHERAASETSLRQLKTQNERLQSELAMGHQQHARDSGIGSSSGSETGEAQNMLGSRKAAFEKTRLETTIRKLQGKLQAAQHAQTVAETSLKTVMDERDSAVAQLGQNHLTTEELKLNNQKLRQQNERMGIEMLELRQAFLAQMREPTTVQTEQARYKGKTGVSNKAFATTEEVTEALDVDVAADPRVSLRNRSRSRSRAGRANGGRPASRIVSVKHGAQDSRERKTRLILEEYSDSDDCTAAKADSIAATITKDLHYSAERPQEQDVQIGQSSTGAPMALGDFTALSQINTGQVAELRAALESQRRERRRTSDYTETSQATGKGKNVDASGSEAGDIRLPRKSSLKRTSSHTRTAKGLEDPTEPTMTSRSLGPTKPGNASQDAAHSRAPPDNMTSAFIVPDITLQRSGHATLKLSTAAQQIFDRLAYHDGTKCTICSRLQGHNGSNSAGKIAIPKPIAVAERRSNKEAEDEDATGRPAQPPGEALALVLKGLEDELAHLKVELSRQQTLYNQHDPALSKRQRKRIQMRIETLLRETDTKADQIYALYDVLEGQKASGQAMSAREFEVTLENVGVSNVAAAMGLRGGHGPSADSLDSEASGAAPSLQGKDATSSTKGIDLRKPSKGQGEATTTLTSGTRSKRGTQERRREVWDLTNSGDDDEDDDLPWNGFGSTGELTGRSMASRRSVYV